MSYRAGTSGLEKIGIASGEPRVICDGCGKVKLAIRGHVAPYQWLLNRRKVPGWFKIILHEHTREDYCSEACYPFQPKKGES